MASYSDIARLHQPEPAQNLIPVGDAPNLGPTGPTPQTEPPLPAPRVRRMRGRFRLSRAEEPEGYFLDRAEVMAMLADAAAPSNAGRFQDLRQREQVMRAAESLRLRMGTRLLPATHGRPTLPMDKDSLRRQVSVGAAQISS
jgi:hypothetical protein